MKKERVRVVVSTADKYKFTGENCAPVVCDKCKADCIVGELVLKQVKEKPYDKLEFYCIDCFRRTRSGELERPTLEIIKKIREKHPDFGEKELREFEETIRKRAL